MRTIPLLIAILLNLTIKAQTLTKENLPNKHLNWHLKNINVDKALGLNLELLYDSILPNLECRDTVVVAVMDGGIDIAHEELAHSIWKNKLEIPGNNQDDDNNGYIDDVHGWNFIGAPNGFNIKYETLEYTRIVKLGESDDNPLYAKAKEEFDKNYAEKKSMYESIKFFSEALDTAINIIKQTTGTEVKNKEDLEKINSTDESVRMAKAFLSKPFSRGLNIAEFREFKQEIAVYIDYHLNPDYNPRDSVGDDPSQMNDNNYGNNNITGPRASHGTAVAGVIAANRYNNLGIMGITNHVKIMPIRTTPEGDERDKDVALGILYAVNNGAKVINMSFGKDFSPQKQFVDSAIQHAEQHDVLLVHAAGNSGISLDKKMSYPHKVTNQGHKVNNWLSVGASNEKRNKHAAAEFSNYSKNHVDVFAPGVNILTTDTANTYTLVDGTSFAAPMVSGVAALLRSYYPELTATQVVEILIASSYPITKPRKVFQPQQESRKRKKVTFANLCKSGGIINAYAAFILAAEIAQPTAKFQIQN